MIEILSWEREQSLPLLSLSLFLSLRTELLSLMFKFKSSCAHKLRDRSLRPRCDRLASSLYLFLPLSATSNPALLRPGDRSTFFTREELEGFDVLIVFCCFVFLRLTLDGNGKGSKILGLRLSPRCPLHFGICERRGQGEKSERAANGATG